jgi:hypothetical protein
MGKHRVLSEPQRTEEKMETQSEGKHTNDSTETVDIDI